MLKYLLILMFLVIGCNNDKEFQEFQELVDRVNRLSNKAHDHGEDLEKITRALRHMSRMPKYNKQCKEIGTLASKYYKAKIASHMKTADPFWIRCEVSTDSKNARESLIFDFDNQHDRTLDRTLFLEPYRFEDIIDSLKDKLYKDCDC